MIGDGHDILREPVIEEASLTLSIAQRTIQRNTSSEDIRLLEFLKLKLPSFTSSSSTEDLLYFWIR